MNYCEVLIYNTKKIETNAVCGRPATVKSHGRWYCEGCLDRSEQLAEELARDIERRLAQMRVDPQDMEEL